MPNVTKTQFTTTLKHGVDTNSPELATRLAGSGVSVDDVKKADLNGDGKIQGGAELDKAFGIADAFDRNGSAFSFKNEGKAGQVFGALVGAKFSGPDFSAAITKAAGDRVASDGANYAYDKAPTSPLATLSGNRSPGVSRPSWLKNNNKCNQFVGDALTQAGVKAPTHKMPDGTLHYVKAEDWPKHTQLFDRITDPSQVRPGDVVVRDYPGTGESTAHVEIVTGTNPMSTTGAHSDGAYEIKDNDWLANTTPNVANRSFTQSSGNEVYVLRPKLAR